MPQGQVYTDKAIQEWLAGYTNGALFADIVAPVIPTDERSGKYRTRLRADASTVHDDRVSPESAINRITYRLGEANFSCEGRGEQDIVPNEDVRQADAPIEPLQDAAEHVMDTLMLGREKRVADLYHATGSYLSGHAVTAGNAWDTTSGTPIADIQAGLAKLPARRKEREKVVMVVDEVAWHALSRNSTLLGLRAGGGVKAGVLMPEEVAQFVGVDEILVSEAEYTTDDGTTYTPVWDPQKAVLTVVPKDKPRRMAGLFMGTFRHKKPGSTNGILERDWFDENIGEEGAYHVAVTFADDEVIVQNDRAYLIQGVTS